MQHIKTNFLTYYIYIHTHIYIHVKAVSNCQHIMRACGLLQALCNILMANGVPADVLTETINTVAEVIRGNSSNQEFLAGVMAPSNPPRYFYVYIIYFKYHKFTVLTHF